MFQNLDSFIDHFFELGVPGCDCIIYSRGKEVYRRTSGYSDREAKIPMTGKERYNLYSCSKVITCTAALQLFDKGLYQLDDPLCRYMPEFTEMTVRTPEGIVPAKTRITVRQLFTMTAGFNYDLASPQLKLGVKETHGAAPTREMMKYLAKEPLDFQPGEKWQYSLCHDVLAAFVEVVSGMPFQDYVQKNIFAPLAMTRSTFLLPEAELSTIAAQYRNEAPEGTPARIVRIGPECPYRIGTRYASGGAGCVSTLEEYSRFLEALRQGDIVLSKETTNLMHQNMLTGEQFSSFWFAARYGYGLGVRCPREGRNTSDWGWGGAAGAYLGIDSAYDGSFFYVQHMQNSPNHNLRQKLPQVILEDFLQQSKS